MTYVDNANEELSSLGKIDLRHEAVADKRFENVLGNSDLQDGESVVKILSYEPNHLTYEVSTQKGGVVVFSENYYPGWTATVDGEPVEVGRVNYILRAIKVKPGTHKVELSFFPSTVKTTENIAYIAYVILLVVILAIAFLGWRRKKTW